VSTEAEARTDPTQELPITVSAPESPIDADAPRGAINWPSFFSWIRNVGAIILLFVAWQLWGTAIGEHHAQDLLQQQFNALIHETRAHSATTPRSGQSLIPASVHVPQPPEGSVVAEIDIPAIGVHQYVVSGTATADLAKGPGHYIGTAMPGQAGNIAIAGHRTTHGAPFNRLGDLAVGDTIILTNTNDQHFTYVVSEAPFAVSPSNTAVLGDFGDNRITLTTCTPEFSAAERLIVVGELKLANQRAKKIPLTARSRKSVPYEVVNPATASWNWGLLPIVLLEVAFLALLGLFNRRLASIYGRFGGWLILTPVWIAGLCVLFQSLTNFFPPSL
jgi:sortase A